MSYYFAAKVQQIIHTTKQFSNFLLFKAQETSHHPLAMNLPKQLVKIIHICLQMLTMMERQGLYTEYGLQPFFFIFIRISSKTRKKETSAPLP